MSRSFVSRFTSLALISSMAFSLAACSKEESPRPLFVSVTDSCHSTPVLISSDGGNVPPTLGDLPTDRAGRWEWANTQADAFVQAAQASPLNIAALHTDYGASFQDVFFAHALASRLTPHDVVALLKRVNDEGKTSDQESRTIQQAFLADLGSFIALSLGGANLSEQAVPSLTLLISPTTPSTSAQPDLSVLNEDIDRHVMGYTALLLLDDTASYSDDEREAREVATTLVTEALAVAGESNPNLIIGPKVFSSQIPSAKFSLAEIFVLADRSERSPLLLSDVWAQRHSSHGLVLLSDAPALGSSDRVLKDLLTAHVDTARSFFSRTSVLMHASADAFRYPTVSHSAVRSEHGSRIGITRFLTGHQHQTHEGNMGFPDCGEAFGKLIADLSAPPTSLDGEDVARDEDAVSIARQFLLGYQEALDRDHTSFSFFTRRTDKVEGQDLFSYTNPRLRSWMGVVLSRHVEGLFRYVTSATLSVPTSAPVSSVSGRHLLAFSATERASFTGANGVFSDLLFDQPTPVSVRPRELSYEIQYEGGRPPATALILRNFWRFITDSFGKTPLDSLEPLPDVEEAAMFSQYVSFFSAFALPPIMSTPEAHQAAIDFLIFNYSADISLIIPTLPHEVGESAEEFLPPSSLKKALPTTRDREITPGVPIDKIARDVVASNMDVVFTCLYYENTILPRAADAGNSKDLPYVLQERGSELPQSCLDLPGSDLSLLRTHGQEEEHINFLYLPGLADSNTPLVVPHPLP